MAKNEEEGNCGEDCSESTCCQVISIISVDDRGQTVLPKEVRDRMGIKGGDKLAVVLSEGEGDSCCVFLMKVNELSDAVRGKLGPVLEEMIG
ncbi:MAG: AbrB/MazE/SpoVT family DNA-binding domain-containing protein [Thermoplasmata archaeon]|nr:AbrB/MazE/SpoVT family DNA-binding domain-containing protein [Thermoplasmata archaeon]